MREYGFISRLFLLKLWHMENQKSKFIKEVDKGRITTVKNLESWRFER